jgi:hypothetical protein
MVSDVTGGENLPPRNCGNAALDKNNGWQFVALLPTGAVVLFKDREYGCELATG